MAALRITSGMEQVVNHLRESLAQGRWIGTMPGRNTLAAELGVNRKTVDAALRQLENEGLLVSQGLRRRRRIEMRVDSVTVRPLLVAILSFDPPRERSGFILELARDLQIAGHTAFFAKGSLLELKMNVQRVARLVERTEADAWVIVSASRDVLEWFSARSIPAFALFGRRHGVPMAGIGPDKVTPMRLAVRRLFELGHRRIAMISRAVRRLPEPGTMEQAVLSELDALGVKTSSYNLPDWEENINGLHSCLDSMMRITPPTALFIDEAQVFLAVQHYFTRRGILSPEQISLVCNDPDPAFNWLQPSVAHIRWDSEPWLRRIVEWANNVSRGKTDRRQSSTKVVFVEGGTVGPAPGR